MKSNIFQGKDTEIKNTCICVVVQMLNSKALLVQICHFVVWIRFMLPCTSCREEIVDEQYDINVNGNTYFKIIEKINIQPCLLLFSLEHHPNVVFGKTSTISCGEYQCRSQTKRPTEAGGSC